MLNNKYFPLFKAGPIWHSAETVWWSCQRLFICWKADQGSITFIHRKCCDIAHKINMFWSITSQNVYKLENHSANHRTILRAINIGRKKSVFPACLISLFSFPDYFRVDIWQLENWILASDMAMQELLYSGRILYRPLIMIFLRMKKKFEQHNWRDGSYLWSLVN